MFDNTVRWPRHPVGMWLAAILLVEWVFLPNLNAEISENGPPVRALLTLDMKGAEDCPPSLIEEMKEEVAEVFRPVGLGLQWRYLDLSRIRPSVDALVVVTFNGACTSDGFGQPVSDEGPMGWTAMTDGAILPFCGVDYDRVREVMRRTIRWLPPGEQERLFGRAIGRVLAHELYHILANTRGHSRRGLAKPLLSDAELAQEELRFGGDEIERIHKSMLRSTFKQAPAREKPEQERTEARQ
ncbi:MAG: hypothetical protein JNL98_24870 [Bryobacterales bacterium]|nr:hypothetical protein [Bryobacterales bacterium]